MTLAFWAIVVVGAFLGCMFFRQAREISQIENHLFDIKAMLYLINAHVQGEEHEDED